jgi:hypothetical protein
MRGSLTSVWIPTLRQLNVEHCLSLLQAYCQAILPAPETMSLPMCWTQERLGQLQHRDIEEPALRQQVGEHRLSCHALWVGE